MLAGTAEHRLEAIDTALAITAGPDIAPADVGAMVEQAERMCFVLDAIQRPNAVTRTTSLNGLRLD